jgi:hypothetical protein
MDSPPTPKRLHKSSPPSSSIWILLHSQKASQEFISKFWHMDSPPLPKGFTRVHLQVLGYGFSYYTPRRLHNCSYYCLNLNYVKFEIATIHTPNTTWNSQKTLLPVEEKRSPYGLNSVFFFHVYACDCSHFWGTNFCTQ